MKKETKEVIRERVKNVLKMVHLEGYDKDVSEPDVRWRAAKGRDRQVHCHGTQTLNADEPLSNLDANSAVDMRYEIKTLHEPLQITSIYVTHDQQEALALSDRIVVMKSGDIQQIGTPNEIYSRPANLLLPILWGSRILACQNHRDQRRRLKDGNYSKHQRNFDDLER